MRNLDQALKEIRPSLRLVAPLTYFISWGFAIFNVAVSIPLYRINEVTFALVGAINIKVWATIFLLTGLFFAYSLIANNWKLTRSLMLIGVCVKSAWLMELLARTTNGKSFILVAIWSLIVYLQAITYIYFTPAEIRHDG